MLRKTLVIRIHNAWLTSVECYVTVTVTFYVKLQFTVTVYGKLSLDTIGLLLLWLVVEVVDGTDPKSSEIIDAIMLVLLLVVCSLKVPVVFKRKPTKGERNNGNLSNPQRKGKKIIACFFFKKVELVNKRIRLQFHRISFCFAFSITHFSKIDAIWLSVRTLRVFFFIFCYFPLFFCELCLILTFEILLLFLFIIFVITYFFFK